MLDTKKDKNIHANHRSRVKKSFLENGLRGFAEHNVLELMMFFTVPRANTNVPAHELLEKFGTFSKTFEASEEEFKEIKGVGSETARFIRVLYEIVKYYEEKKRTERITVSNSEEASKLLEKLFVNNETAEMYAVYLDKNCGVLKCTEICETKEEMIKNGFRSLFAEGLNINAGGFILAENKRNGLCVPLKEDIIFSEKLADAAKKLSFIYCEHIIFGDNEKYFFSKSKKIKKNIFAF